MTRAITIFFICCALLVGLGGCVVLFSGCSQPKTVGPPPLPPATHQAVVVPPRVVALATNGACILYSNTINHVNGWWCPLVPQTNITIAFDDKNTGPIVYMVQYSDRPDVSRDKWPTKTVTTSKTLTFLKTNTSEFYTVRASNTLNKTCSDYATR